MNASTTKFELLSKNNYDTWKLQMKAILIKNSVWKYVSGTCKEPVITDTGNAAQLKIHEEWKDNDEKAKSDLILSIYPSELKQIKYCETSKEVWTKLEAIYQSKGPARKATLLKRLVLHRMSESDDIRDHIHRFADTVDKLSELDVQVNEDLLSILLLYGLPSTFDNFRCAIESRDELPNFEALKVKIIEESDARKKDNVNSVPNAMAASHKYFKKFPQSKNFKESQDGNRRQFPKIKCYKCGKIGHKANDCYSNKQGKHEYANHNKNYSLHCLAGDKNVYNMLHDTNVTSKHLWCIDSGCSSHLCNDAKRFDNMISAQHKEVNLANGQATQIIGQGSVALIQANQCQTNNVELKDVFLVPEIKTNLLSVGRITSKGHTVIFKKENATIIDEDGHKIMTAKRIGDLYFVEEGLIEAHNVVESTTHKIIEKWHRRLGHLNPKSLCDMSRNDIVRDIDAIQNINNFQCEVCALGKMSSSPFAKKSDRSSKKLEIVHTDLCGPMRVTSMGGSRYFLTFIDDNSRWCEIYFIKHKSEVLQKFKEYKAMVENQTGCKIKYLQSDNGTEYVNNEFEEFLKTSGIQRRTTIPHTPQQNGISERKNRTIVETARCLMIQSGLPSYFWAEAVLTSNYIRNRCPTSSLNGKTPFEAWIGHKPTIKHFKEFGSHGFILNKNPNKGKFEPRSERCIFLGYSIQSKGFRVWLPERRKVENTRDVKFIESTELVKEPYVEFSPLELTEATKEHTTSESNMNNEKDNEFVDDEIREDEEEINVDADRADNENEQILKRTRGRPKRILTGNRGRPKKQYHYVRDENMARNEEIEENEPNEEYANVAEVTLKEALSSNEANEWLRAISLEIKSIIKNKTWEITERVENQNTIGSRFVLNIKKGCEEGVGRKKARLVAKGFAQRPGIDFNDTFSPVTRMDSIRLMMSLASKYNMRIEQIDITTAYLNGVLDEDIFMEIPQHFEEGVEYLIKNEDKGSDISKTAIKMLNDIRKGNRICHLHKALYGLKQAGRQWFIKLSDKLREYGLQQSRYDSCVFYSGKDENLLMLCVYVDDILISCKDVKQITRLRQFLEGSFDVKDLGEISYCLGIEFTRNGNMITMCQSNYITDLLERYNMVDANPSPTPMVDGSKLERSVECDNKPYRELVGSLNYLATCTRPDIAHSVSILGQFNDCHDEQHWIAAKRVLRYLKGTRDVGLVYGTIDDSLIGYVDADWGGNIIDRKSYSGYVFTLGGTAISWESRKQRSVATSSAEAEYIGLAEAAKESLSLNNFLIELGFEKLASKTIYNDSQSAQFMVKNNNQHGRTKHIDIRYHFIRDLAEKDMIIIKYKSTNDMVADILTKNLSKLKHTNFSTLIGLTDVSALRGSVKKYNGNAEHIDT